MKAKMIKEYKGRVGIYYPDSHKFITAGRTEAQRDVFDVTLDEHEVSDDVKLRFIKEDFCWGKILAVHTIGDYQIIESKAKDAADISFHCFINYEELNRSTDSLEKALLTCIAAETKNIQAVPFICRMLQM